MRDIEGRGKWLGVSRMQLLAQNTLGIVYGGEWQQRKMFRKPQLDLYDAYYESRQYDDLQNWNTAALSETYIPIRERKPRIIYNVGKTLVDKVSAKLVGTATFPKFVVEEDPDDTEFFRLVAKVTNFKANLLEPIRGLLRSGSVFVRFYLVNGVPIIEWAPAKFCYPQFDDAGHLTQLEIRYTYEDFDDKDGNGKPKWKWYRILLTSTADILFDNPAYVVGAEPQFQEVERQEHGLGFVQGEWFRTVRKKFDPDGDSLIDPVMDFIDELNYSLSQSSQAIGYNQEPQLGLNNMDQDEIEKLIKSSQKSWNLGREGNAKFIESSMRGVEVAKESREEFRKLMLEVIRVVLHDPEKMVANAQSGRALEILNAPLVELVDELRTAIEPNLKSLLIKIGLTLLEMNARGEETVLDVAPGYLPQSLDLTVQWPPIYPLTIEDLQKKAQIAQSLSTAMLVSRESLTRWIAPDLGIENIDEELQKIEDEPIMNPFGGFGQNNYGNGEGNPAPTEGSAGGQNG